jgi:hypothetical protein
MNLATAPKSTLGRPSDRGRATSMSAEPEMTSIPKRRCDITQAYQANRRAAIEDLVDADPIAAWVRQIMANRSTWRGSASDLLRAGAALAGPGLPSGASAWPKSPRELAGRLRRAQTFLRVVGIHIAFGREGRGGTRVIRISTRPENTVSTVSTGNRAS